MYESEIQLGTEVNIITSTYFIKRKKTRSRQISARKTKILSCILNVTENTSVSISSNRSSKII